MGSSKSNKLVGGASTGTAPDTAPLLLPFIDVVPSTPKIISTRFAGPFTLALACLANGWISPEHS